MRSWMPGPSVQYVELCIGYIYVVSELSQALQKERDVLKCREYSPEERAALQAVNADLQQQLHALRCVQVSGLYYRSVVPPSLVLFAHKPSVRTHCRSSSVSGTTWHWRWRSRTTRAGDCRSRCRRWSMHAWRRTGPLQTRRTPCGSKRCAGVTVTG